MDEPTVGLDPKRAATIYTHLRKLVAEEGRTILIVDQNVIAGVDVADYIYVLELGANKLEGHQGGVRRRVSRHHCRMAVLSGSEVFARASCPPPW